MEFPSVLSVDNLSVWRGERCLCRELNFRVVTGEALQVQGHNGAGKTTLIRVLTGLGRADEGEVRWRGEPLRRNDAEYRASLAYLGHSNGVKLGLSPRENLAAASALLATPIANNVDATLERVGLRAHADMPCGMLSMGQRRRTALARLLLANVRLWFLDEPLASLDVAGVTLLIDMLKTHLSGGGIVVFATHQVMDLAPYPVKSVMLGTSA
ncbi:MAG TPA: cytochrome c biogenesis heme-transporting ATPase CcmA [Gammaproteobacteria bacterium]|nr:cytochrome c biogenesis heme-transporting ATPase CcmA [Gammaproteobacteria bacterium]